MATSELTASGVRAGRRQTAGAIGEWLAGGRLYLVLAGAALAIGAFSLLIPSTPSYDPWAWLVWGREIVHLNLQTTGGPSWKPLPMIFTVLFAPFGKAQPDLWLVVARAGAVMAAVMVFKVTARITSWLTGVRAGAGVRGPQRALALAPALLAGAIAACGLVFSGGFISDNALGYSEGLMTALVLIAVERHLDGHPRQAFALGFFAALDRPEIWLFWGPYGLYLWWKDPGARRLVVALFVLIPVCWFLPEYWGSGHFLRGVNRAQHPRSNSNAFAHCPFCAELKSAWPLVLLRIKIAAAAAVAVGAWVLWRARRGSGGSLRERLVALAPRDQREHAIAMIVATGLLGLAWWVVIAVLTQGGFSGNNRYLVLGAALIEIAGGAGWGWLAIELGRRGRRFAGRGRGEASAGGADGVAVAAVAVAFLLVPGWVGNSLIDLSRTHRSLVYQAQLRADLSSIVRDAGGARRLLACGSIMTEGFQVPMVAYALGVHTSRVQAPPFDPNAPGPAPNVILQARDTRHANLLPLPATIVHWEQTGARYQTALHVRTFRLFSTCAVR